MKHPSFQFYPGDWLRDNIAGCSIAAQGLWLRMMFVMHDSEQYGYLGTQTVPLSHDAIARRCGLSRVEYDGLLSELDAAGIPSRTPDGTIYSRRMVRDASEREANRRRVKEHRGRRNGDVMPMKLECNPPSSSSSSTSRDPPVAPPPDVTPTDPALQATTDAVARWKALDGRGDLSTSDLSEIARMHLSALQAAPVVRGSTSTPAHLLIPQAVDELIRRRAKFTRIAYAVECITGKLDDWRTEPLSSLRNQTDEHRVTAEEVRRNRERLGSRK